MPYGNLSILFMFGALKEKGCGTKHWILDIWYHLKWAKWY